MQNSIVGVHYDCHTLQVLSECSIPGHYEYHPVVHKEEIVRIDRHHNAGGTLPLASLSATIRAEISAGFHMDVATKLVAVAQTTDLGRTPAVPSTCQRATHYVRGAYLGAYAFGITDSNSTSTSLELFGAGVSGGTESSFARHVKQGDTEACRQLTGSETSAAPQCAALHGVWLSPLVYECDQTNRTMCRTQCDRGHAESCRLLAVNIGQGDPDTPPDPKAALPYWKKACRLGSCTACQELPFDPLVASELPMLMAVDKDPERKREALDAAKWWDLGCQKDCSGCCNQYALVWEQVGEPGAAALLHNKACDLGEASSCYELGLALEGGLGVERNTELALVKHRFACEHGINEACERTQPVSAESLAPPPAR